MTIGDSLIFQAYYNSLIEIPDGIKSYFSSLNGLDNLNFSTLSHLRITRCAGLSVCDIAPVCTYLENSGSAYIDDNAPGCNSIEEIFYTCNSPQIYNRVFYDLNQNAVWDSGEPDFEDAILTLEPGQPFNGGVLYLAPGSYTVAYDAAENPNWVLTTPNTAYSFMLNSGDTESAEFGIYPTSEISEIQTFTNPFQARCKLPKIIHVRTKNLGTTTASGTIWLEIDENIDYIDPLDVPDTTTVSGLLGWYFSDLYPSQTLEKRVTILIPGPPDFPLGDPLHFETYVEYTDATGINTSSIFAYDPEVTCSYDPNDKLVSPSRPFDEVLLDEDLIYTIRFQNTGNDVAYDVTIRDTLDANLDVSTFRVLGSSHSEVLNTSLNDKGVITFDFRNIFLPDSTSNLEGSNGYVTYMIRAIEGINENTVIRNSAGIYFDQNPPVITNTTENIMVSILTSTTTPDLFPNLTIFPNPNTGTFQIEGISRGTYQLLNTTGQVIQSGQLENETLINISKVAQGVYFIQMLVDEHIVTRRVVKL